MSAASSPVHDLDPLRRRLIERLPKAELHLHLEGSVEPELALALARKHGKRLPGDEAGVEGLRRNYVFKDFGDFLRMYLAISACLTDEDDFAAIVVDLARKLAADNVRYAEVTFTPMTHVNRGVAGDTLLAGLAEGRARARAEHGVELAWVFDIVRHRFAEGEPTLALALEGREVGVIGLGFAGPESPQWPTAPYAPLFARARAEGLRSLPHAGEMDGPSSVWSALRELGAERIGHGVQCLADPALVEHLREHRVPLEVCPTSNVGIGLYPALAGHPLPQLLAAGLQVSLASDDPPMFATSLGEEYRRCTAAFGWDAPQIAALARNSVEHSFMPAEAKARLLAEQAAVLAELRPFAGAGECD
ncbi:aminodeoxyfutalosine deaminase [Nannocystis exedens]|uniref:Aminodeoxyfutalosine deaminase n=1 Tax=Nannocystis exedens TaxID=54 RepID=A0A1I1UF05_9BACT|nr:adenosine deaminase [Nannocystis exedens]PCC71646.1 Aminodeoxyfutalosine deaminase [Nannocystis exedens]SFD69185.1 aminodeoxyfutalosine deaminase [Nannocystis exedens]